MKPSMGKAWFVAFGILGLLSAADAAQAGEEQGATIQNNSDVGLEYTVTVDGAVVDSTEGRGAFHYVHGAGQIVPGLERGLLGLKAGDTKEVIVKPEEGYGLVDQAAFVELLKAKLPQNITPEVGMVLQGMNPEGRAFPATISAVKGDSVTLNLNHPLAGKTLLFKVKILTITPAAKG